MKDQMKARLAGMIMGAAILALVGVWIAFQDTEPMPNPPDATQEAENEPVSVEKETVEPQDLSKLEPTYEDANDQLLAEISRKNGVDELLAIGISRLETGNYTSSLFESGHNYGGMLGVDGYMRWDTMEEGAEAYIRLLAWYRDQGMTTPEEMAEVYCPGNDEWAKIVNKIMEEKRQ